MSKKQAGILALLTLMAFVLAFMISNRVFYRIDMTKDKNYTISDASRNLQREISDVVTITYFVSERLSNAHPLPSEIADLVREYAAHSRGRIRFIQRDPARAGITREIEGLGILPQRIQVVERNETTVATVYSGILIEYLDRQSVMPVVFSLETLEYDISSRIRSLVRNTENVLGVIVADSHKDWQSEYSLLHQELFLSGFQVRLIRPGEEIPPDLPALFVLGGAEDLDIDALYSIDRYIFGGGNVLFATDGIIIDVYGNFDARPASDQGLLAMLTNYGVIIQPYLVQDLSALNLTYQSNNWNITTIRTVRYPQWIAVQESYANMDHPITALFDGIDLFWASPLELVPSPLVSADILFTSTEHAWLQTENFITSPEMVFLFEDEADDTKGVRILGAALSGVFPSTFQFDENNTGRPARIIVVGNTNFAGSLMQLNRGSDRNIDFLIRAAEWLSSDDDLLSIRIRERPQGRLDRITDIELRNIIMTSSRLINTFVIPLVIIIIGIIIGIRRKAKTKARGVSGEF